MLADQMLLCNSLSVSVWCFCKYKMYEIISLNTFSSPAAPVDLNSRHISEEFTIKFWMQGVTDRCMHGVHCKTTKMFESYF